MYAARDHEKDCEYAPVRCPNSSKCPVVMKKVSAIIRRAAMNVVGWDDVFPSSPSEILPHSLLPPPPLTFRIWEII